MNLVNETVVNTPAPFAGVDVSWNRFAEAALLLKASGGAARVKLGPNFPGTTAPTGLANDATVYTATVRVDGVNEAVSIVGSAAQTITTLIAELNTDLSATVALEGDEIVITSTTTGDASAVFVSDSGANFLFSSIRGGVTAAPSGARFGVTNYDSTRGWFNIAGSTNRVGESVRGNNFYFRWDKMDATQQDYVSGVVDTFLAAAAANTNQPWVNAASSLAVPTGLPSILTETGLSRATVYQLQVNVNGAGNVTVSVDLNIPQTTGATFEQLLAALNAGLGAVVQADGTPLPVVAEWRDGYNATQPPRVMFRVLTSNTLFGTASTGAVLQGTTSSLVLTAGLANDLVAALVAFGGVLDVAQAGFGVVNFNRVNAAAVLPATVPAVATGNYDISISVDGGAVTDYVIAVTVADTMTVIAATIAAATALTVEAVGNKFVFTSPTATWVGTVAVTIPTVAPGNPDLFNAIAAALDVVDLRGDTDVSTWSVRGFATPGINGTTNLVFPKTVDSIAYANWLAVLDTMQVGGRITGQFLHGLTGFGPLFTSSGGASFEREWRPVALGQCVGRDLYWDGAAWRYFVQGDASRVAGDDTSAGANNPPQSQVLNAGL